MKRVYLYAAAVSIVDVAARRSRDIPLVVFAGVYVQMCVHACEGMRVHKCVSVRMCMAHVHVRVRVRVSLCVCACARAYVCLGVCVYVGIYTHTCMHAYACIFTCAHRRDWV
jgi:hypothetical protein